MGLSAMTVYRRHHHVARHHSTPLRQLGGAKKRLIRVWPTAAGDVVNGFCERNVVQL
jgi:hypothetical protein